MLFVMDTIQSYEHYVIMYEEEKEPTLILFVCNLVLSNAGSLEQQVAWSHRSRRCSIRGRKTCRTHQEERGKRRESTKLQKREVVKLVIAISGI